MIAWQLLAAGFAGGALNSVAGGGSFVGFPALLAAGISPVQANATCTFVMWPGTLSSICAYREELRDTPRGAWPLAAVSLLGGVLGAALLLAIPAEFFTGSVPFLMLMASAVFTWGAPLGDWLAHRYPATLSLARPPWPLVLLQLALATYGGFFGAGLGIMMLSVLLLLGLRDMHRLNASKAVLGATINVASIAGFAWAGVIVWPEALAMAVAAMLGGYTGARLGRRCPPAWVRGLVLLIAWAMTAMFFCNTFR